MNEEDATTTVRAMLERAFTAGAIDFVLDGDGMPRMIGGGCVAAMGAAGARDDVLDDVDG